MSFPARAVFVLLVAATFAAFFVAQRLKSAPPVASIQSLTQHFSPNGDGRRDVSRIRVRVRKDDDVTITIVDEADNEVRRLATGVPAVARQPVPVTWDGDDEQGSRAPEGVYRIRVGLRRGGRAVTLNCGLRLDVTAAAAERLRGRRGRPRVDHRAGRRAGAVPRPDRLRALPDAHPRAEHERRRARSR